MLTQHLLAHWWSEVLKMAAFNYVFFLLILPLLLLFLKTKRESKNSYRILPPGPWTLPIIGSLHHLTGTYLAHRKLRNMSRRYGDLMFLQLGEHPTVIASSREAVKEITKTHNLKFCTRPVNSTSRILSYDMKDIVFAPYGKYWREIRKMCVSELLSSKRVQFFKSIHEEEIRSLIKWISSSSSQGEIVELNQGLLALTNNVALQAIMGGKCSKQKMFSDGITKAVEQHTGYNLANMFPSYRVAHLLSGAVSKAKECHCSLDRQLDEIIREHREKGADEKVEDLLTVLLRLHDEGSGTDSLSMDSVKAVITDLIAAGSVTTAVSLDWIMAELMKNPAVMKKAQFEVRQQLQGRENITKSDVAKLEFMHLIIKETMRLHPPVPFISRECQETCQILGYDIPKGTSVLINVWSLGRDSLYWKDAEQFRPERFAEYNRDVNFRTDFELIPFGAGRRICPGTSFALVTVELALANLLYHFDWELPSGMKPDDLDMTENSGFTVSRKSPLLLHARPYHRIHASS